MLVVLDPYLQSGEAKHSLVEVDMLVVVDPCHRTDEAEQILELGT